MKPNAIVAVLALNAALAAALFVLWSDGDRRRWPEPAALPPSFEDVVAAAPATEAADVSRYRETLERPLFAQSRRMAPRVEPGSEGQEAVDPLKDVRLLGAYGAGPRGGVVIMRGGKVQRVAVGEKIGNWKVTGQEGRGVSLVGINGERRTLELALNTTAPALPDAAKKGEAQQAQPSAAGSTGGATAAPAAASSRPVSPSGRAMSDEDRERLRRQQIERINAGRARRGLPPLKE